MRRGLAALIALVAVAAFAASALADMSFTDPSGDPIGPSGVGPDITTVTVANNSDDTISFRVTIANYQQLPVRAFVALFFDLDKNADTGDLGSDLRIGWVPDIGVTLERWEDTGFLAGPADGIEASFSGGVFTLVVPRAHLANVESFRFFVGALVLDGQAVARDLAPDEGQIWTYDVVARAVVLAGTKPTGAPKRPVAGKLFTVSHSVHYADTRKAIAGGRVTCSARVASARVKTSARFRAGKAHCAIRIPAKAKGKRLRGTMTTRFSGAKVTKTFSYRVG